MPADLTPRQIEIGDVVLGRGTRYVIRGFAAGGKPAIRHQDKDRALSDGIMFGRDQHGGRVITIEFSVNETDYGSADLAWSRLLEAWEADAVRSTPSRVMPMRLRMHDGDTRVVFGRPREIDPASTDLIHRGRIDGVAQFQCIDGLYYSDLEDSNTVGIIPPSSDGFVAPFTTPLTMGIESAGRVAEILVSGRKPSWLVARINGPIMNPTIDVVGQWKATLRVNLAAGQYVDVNSTPWGRSVRQSNGANLAGEFTADSRRLAEMQLQRGINEVVLRGYDPTGTASLNISWRNAWNTF